MRRMTLALLCICIPSAAFAAPITFNFAADNVSGWYTFETQTPGVRNRYEGEDVYWDRDGAMTYLNAITEFGIELGQGDAFISGRGGDLTLAVNRGELSESSYSALLPIGQNWRLALSIWSPTNGSFLASESLDAVPDLTGYDIISEVVMFDARRPAETASFHQMSSFSRAGATDTAELTSASTLAVAAPTKVPEPSTMLLMGFGLIAAFSRGCRSRIYGR